MKHKTRTERVYNEATGWYETREVELKGYTFTDDDRILIVREYLESGVAAEKIIKKYHISSRSVLFSWMDKFLNEKDSLPLQQEPVDDDDMAKTKDERLKEKDTELNFGTKNDFYHLMYVFDSSQVASRTVTLHLCVLEQSYTSAYRVELFSLSPEFYHMLKSINDINNNDIGAHGLAFIQPTYTNISGGYGCVAGYGCVKSAWLR